MESRRSFGCRRIGITSLELLILIGVSGNDDNILFSGTAIIIETDPITTSDILTEPLLQPQVESPLTGILRNDTVTESQFTTGSFYGSKIVFLFNRSTGYYFCEMDADGSDVVTLTDNSERDGCPPRIP